MHSICVTKGPLATYKLFVRVYGGKYDGDLNNKHPNTVGLLKFVTLYSIMLSSFFGKGHCLVMDSAYMGGRHGIDWAVCLVDQYDWNSTIQSDGRWWNGEGSHQGEGDTEGQVQLTVLSA